MQFDQAYEFHNEKHWNIQNLAELSTFPMLRSRPNRRGRLEVLCKKIGFFYEKWVP